MADRLQFADRLMRAARLIVVMAWGAVAGAGIGTCGVVITAALGGHVRDGALFVLEVWGGAVLLFGLAGFVHEAGLRLCLRAVEEARRLRDDVHANGTGRLQ